MDVIQKEAVSVVPCNFKQEDGSTRRSWRVYLKAEDGAIGSVYAGVIIGIKPAKLDKHWIRADFIPAL